MNIAICWQISNASQGEMFKIRLVPRKYFISLDITHRYSVVAKEKYLLLLYNIEFLVSIIFLQLEGPAVCLDINKAFVRRIQKHSARRGQKISVQPDSLQPRIRNIIGNSAATYSMC